MAKITISLQDELLEKLDNHCKNNFTSRSGFISQSINNTLLTFEIPEALNKICFLFEQVAKDKEIDEKTMQDLLKIKTIAEVLKK